MSASISLPLPVFVDLPPLAAVVCFEPERAFLTRTIQDLRAGGLVDVLLVDNSETDLGRSTTDAVALAQGVELHRAPANVGVAEAQNRALSIARGRGYRYLLLLDQDSRLSNESIAELISAVKRLAEQGRRVAAVGPTLVDSRNGFVFPFVRVGFVRMRRFWPQPRESTACDMLISSGCLLDLHAVDDIGEMDAAFFIDYVDVEWCARARSRGFELYGLADAKMEHTIGRGCMRIMGRGIPVPMPYRHYYLTRNAVLLGRKPYLSWRWRLHLIYRVTAQLVLFTLLAAPRTERFAWMMRGILDGLRGRAGRLGRSSPLPATGWVETSPGPSLLKAEAQDQLAK